MLHADRVDYSGTRRGGAWWSRSQSGWRVFPKCPNDYIIITIILLLFTIENYFSWGQIFLTWHHVVLQWAGPVQDDERVAALHSNHSEVMRLVFGRLLLIGCQAVLLYQVFQDVDLKKLQSLRQGAWSTRVLPDVVHIGSWWQEDVMQNKLRTT